jgi:hypothetical protein
MEPDAFLEMAYEDRYGDPDDLGYEIEDDPEDLWVEDDPEFPAGTMVRLDDIWCAAIVKRVQGDWAEVVLVGDDIQRLYEVSCLTKIEREEFCGQCGQIGCGHDGLER